MRIFRSELFTTTPGAAYLSTGWTIDLHMQQVKLNYKNYTDRVSGDVFCSHVKIRSSCDIQVEFRPNFSNFISSGGSTVVTHNVDPVFQLHGTRTWVPGDSNDSIGFWGFDNDICASAMTIYMPATYTGVSRSVYIEAAWDVDGNPLTSDRGL